MKKKKKAILLCHIQTQSVTNTQKTYFALGLVFLVAVCLEGFPTLAAKTEFGA